jgi:hypothetical protein
MNDLSASGRQEMHTRVHLTDTVVSMKAYRSQQVKDEDLTDIKQPVGQINYARRIMREWIGLPDDQFKLVWFIFGKTIAWQNAGDFLTYRLMEKGDHKSLGLGKTERAIRNSLTKLEKAGVVRVNRDEEFTKGLFISINLDWTPVKNTPTATKKVNPVAKLVTQQEVRFRPPRKSISAPPGSGLPDIKAPLLKQDFSKHDSSSHCAAPRLAGGDNDFDLSTAYGEEEREPTALPQKTSSAPIAPPPSSMTKVENGRATHSPKSVDGTKLVLKPGAIEATFRAAFVQSFASFPGVVCPDWTKSDYGKVKRMFIESWNGSADGAHALVAWSVTNWWTVLASEFGWMRKTKPPEFPTISFFLWQWRTFAVAFGRDHTETWLRSLKDFEQRDYVRLTVKEGMTAEEARMKIAKDRAALMMREKNAKVMEAASKNYRSAAMMEENAKRYGALPIHPDSQRGLEIRREAKALREKELLEHELRKLKIQDQHRRDDGGFQESSTQVLVVDGIVIDLMAACEEGWKNGDWSK